MHIKPHTFDVLEICPIYTFIIYSWRKVIQKTNKKNVLCFNNIKHLTEIYGNFRDFTDYRDQTSEHTSSAHAHLSIHQP